MRAAVDDLERLARLEPDLAAAARTTIAVVRAAFAEVEPEPTDAEAICAAIRVRLEHGLTGYGGGALDLDTARLARRVVAVEKALGRRDARGVGTLTAAEIREQAARFVTSSTRSDEPAVEDAVLRLALRPALGAWADRLAPLTENEACAGGNCPLCGRPGVLGELRGLERRVYLRCLGCAASWPSPRLGCASCGAARVERLSPEGDDGERVQVVRCHDCERHVVLVSSLGRLGPAALVGAELRVLPYFLEESEETAS